MLMLRSRILMLTGEILTIRIFLMSFRIFLISIILPARPEFLLLLDDVIAQLIVTVEKCLDATGNALFVRGSGVSLLLAGNRMTAEEAP